MAAGSGTRFAIEKFRSSLKHCVAAVALLGFSVGAHAQSSNPSLEDLIPDTAVENPDSWAEQGADQAIESSDLDAPDPDTPISQPLGFDLPWPEDIAIEDFQPLEPDEDIEFADLDLGQPSVSFEEAETDRIGDNLVLGFPQTEPPFSGRGDFVERFEALSTIEELEDSEANLAQLAARAREDEELLGDLLRVYGYYDGQVIRSIGNLQAGEATASETLSLIHI